MKKPCDDAGWQPGAGDLLRAIQGSTDRERPGGLGLRRYRAKRMGNDGGRCKSVAAFQDLTEACGRLVQFSYGDAEPQPACVRLPEQRLELARAL